MGRVTTRLLVGDCRQKLAELADESVHCIVTSPPYYGLRDYGVDGQIGLEATPEAYVAELVAVFRECRRVLRSDGTLWCNLGDSYAAKNLIGIPWLVAFALRADGWWLRQDIIWAKPNPMPESVLDRCTKSHEYLFMLSKNSSYYYDNDAVREPYSEKSIGRYEYEFQGTAPTCNQVGGDVGRRERERGIRPPNPLGRNRRSVWTINSEPFNDAHFATFPPALVEPCIKAGSRVGDTILDPFAGAGTTGLVADRLGRNAVLIELNPAYAGMMRDRIVNDAPLFAEVMDAAE
jgi:DNA modification methylase